MSDLKVKDTRSSQSIRQYQAQLVHTTTKMRVAVLSSYTADLLPKETDKRLTASNLTAEWYVAPFNQYRQEILDPNSSSKLFDPQVVLLTLSSEEFLSNSEEVFSLIEQASVAYCSATILVHNIALMKPEPMTLLEWNTNSSKRLMATKLNLSLAELVQQLPNVHLLDLEMLAVRYGIEKMVDPRFYYLAKMDYSAFGIQKIAEQLSAALAAISGKRRKVLVLDLDNTLWGSILGEVSLEGVLLSNDGEGKVFYDFQKQIERLYNTGTILAICSKNDEDLAMEVVRTHPYMVLREDKFAAIRINWADKAENIRSIAEELNLGLDSFVFLDDSPHERELVRSALPEILVPELPKDFSDYPKFIADLTAFETFLVTTEDTERGKLYADERQRVNLKKNIASLDDFLRSLNIQISVQQATDFTIPRIAQLTQKTNQFNLTTRRYTESDIRILTENSSWQVLSVSAKDKLGDSGLVGVALIEINHTIAYLDTYLMSCRVLGRGIEQAFMAAVLQKVKATGVEALTAEFIPTKKNGIAKNFLPDNHFKFIDSLFKHYLDKIDAPDWITVNYE
jgi:FkbH-like protein